MSTVSGPSAPIQQGTGRAETLGDTRLVAEKHPPMHLPADTVAGSKLRGGGFSLYQLQLLAQSLMHRRCPINNGCLLLKLFIFESFAEQGKRNFSMVNGEEMSNYKLTVLLNIWEIVLRKAGM